MAYVREDANCQTYQSLLTELCFQCFLHFSSLTLWGLTLILSINLQGHFQMNDDYLKSILTNLPWTDCQTVFCIVVVVGLTKIRDLGPKTYRPPNTIFHFWLPLFWLLVLFHFRHLKLRQNSFFNTAHDFFEKNIPQENP